MRGSALLASVVLACAVSGTADAQQYDCSPEAIDNRAWSRVETCQEGCEAYWGCTDQSCRDLCYYECVSMYPPDSYDDPACRYIRDERYMWCTGRADLSTISPCWHPGGSCCCQQFPELCGSGRPGGGGGGSPPPGGGGGQSCTWCDCYGEFSEFHGEVCGTSADALVEACWNSCY